MTERQDETQGFAIALDVKDLPALAALRGDARVRVHIDGERALVTGPGGPSGRSLQPGGSGGGFLLPGRSLQPGGSGGGFLLPGRSLQRGGSGGGFPLPGWSLLELPAGARFERIAGGLMRPRGKRLPTAREPPPGATLASVLSLSLGVAALPGSAPAPLLLRLRAGGPPREANLLLTGAESLLRWVEGASEVRLRPLAFALESLQPGGSGGGFPLPGRSGARERAAPRRALVSGRPLPPLPGERFSFTGPLAIPAGLSLEPPLDPDAIERLLLLGPGERAIFHADGRLVRLPEGAFVRLSRSAVRASMTPRGPVAGQEEKEPRPPGKAAPEERSAPGDAEARGG